MHSTRQKQILEFLRSKGECTVQSLAEMHEVSEMTIRRDLQALKNMGLIVRSRGGAMLAESVLFEFAFLQRRYEAREAKFAIARVVAGLVAEKSSVILDSGTTTLAVAQQLYAHRKLVVITTSLPIASVMQRHGNAEILLLGGFLRRDSPDLEGPMTEANLVGLKANLAIIGADGIDAGGTAYTHSLNVSRILARAIEAAEKVYVVADSSKLNRSALTAFGHLRDFDGLITDDGAPPELVEAYRAAGASVTVAEVTDEVARAARVQP
jgi:DeoR/GlpR family transcriptional regulator of sugar metabolism